MFITKPNLVREQQHQRLQQNGIAIPGHVRGLHSFVCQILQRDTTEPGHSYLDREVVPDEDGKREEYTIDLKYIAGEVFAELAPALVVDRTLLGEWSWRRSGLWIDRPGPIKLWKEDYHNATTFGKDLLDKPLKEVWEPKKGVGFLLMCFYVIVHPPPKKQKKQQEQRNLPLLPGGGNDSGSGRDPRHDAYEDGPKRQKFN